MRRIINAFRNLVHRDRVERDLDDEMHATVELLVKEKVRAGMTQQQARRAAMLEIGRVEVLKDQVRDVRAARSSRRCFRTSATVLGSSSATQSLR
jgi:hypothetical protein